MSNLEVGCVGWAINEDQPSLGVWMMMVGWLVGWLGPFWIFEYFEEKFRWAD